MASYLSPIINNTFGLAGSEQVQPELKPWQYPGLNKPADPFTDTETSITGSDFSVNASPERSDQLEQPRSSMIRNETPGQDIIIPLSENYEYGDTQGRKVLGKQEDITHGQEKTVQQKPEARMIISTDIKSDIPVQPLKKNVVPANPERLHESKNLSPIQQIQPFPVGLNKDSISYPSNKEDQMIVSNKGTSNGEKTILDKQIKMVEPKIPSPPVFYQQTKKQGIEMGGRDLLPVDQDAPLPEIRTKQETRLIIGKLIVEVIQPEKEKAIPEPPKVIVYDKPAQTSQGRHEGGSTIKVKYGLGQM